MSAVNGYREGVRIPVLKKIDASSAAIEVGDILTTGTAGYLQRAAAGDLVYGVAMQACASPAADGDIAILVDISETAIYEYPPDAGTVTQALVGTTMDVGGPQSINIDASTDDVVKVVGVDTVKNTVLCQFILTYTGVV